VPPRPRRTSSRPRSNRRQLVWATTNVTVAAVAANTVTGIDLTANLRTTGASVLGATIIRTHLRLGLIYATNADQYVTGLIICRDADVVPGIDPFNNPGDDWMLWAVDPPTASGAAIDVFRTVEYDIRAKRRMQELEQRYAIFVGNRTSAAHNIAVSARVLVAMP